MADPDPPDSTAATTDAHEERLRGDTPHPGLRVVLVADRSSEAAALVESLREDGLSVLTCDIVALPERAARLDPFAVVVDMEQPNAVPAVARLLENLERRSLIAVIGSAELGKRLRISATPRAHLFERPVAIGELRAFLGTPREPLVAPAPSSQGTLSQGTGSQGAGSQGAGSQGAGSQATGPAVPQGPDSDALILSDFPAIVGLSEVESILPDLEGGPISTKLAGQLSAEIEALLDASAKRVREQDQEQSQPAIEPNILVPPEMLAMVDDLLAPDEPAPTRGGMDFAALVASASEPRHDRPPTDEVAAVGPMAPARASEPPGTSTGEDEETGIPGPGTQVGHSSPQDSAGLSPATTADPAEAAHRPGSAPPQHTEAPISRGRGPSTLQLHAVEAPRKPPSQHASDEPPDSLTSTGDLPPLTRAGPMIFSSAHPSWGETHPPETTFGPPPLIEEQAPDSREATQGDPLGLLASAVSSRFTGALVLASVDGQRVRRVLLRDGDMVNAASEHPTDALLRFLVERGDLSPEVAELRSARLPLTGRHAAAALIANGFLGQDDLWPVLRAHAEWIIGRALCDAPAVGSIERQPPERLRAEPNVFGGAAGVEVFIEAIRRVLPANEALERLGGRLAHIEEGPRVALLAESALSPEELELVGMVIGHPLERVLDPRNVDITAVVYALVSLQILRARAPSRRPVATGEREMDPLDADAIRQRVRARMALVHEADYFALLGVPSAATSYEIRRAYVELRRTFEPARLLTAATVDLQPDVTLIVDMLDEAYQVLRDPHRRGRYRRAIEAST